MIPVQLILRGAKGIWRGLKIDEVSVDFTQYQSGLIALCGDNGVGKTTLLENMHFYLRMASRPGKLQEQFRLRDSFRDYTVRMSDGTTYRTLIKIDAKSKRLEAYLYRNGECLNDDGKQSTYEAEIMKVFGSEDLFFNSAFMAQGARSIAVATSGQRRALMMEVLGFDKYKAYRDYAKSEADKIEEELAEVQRTLLAIDSDILVLPELEKRSADEAAELASLEIQRTNTVATLADGRKNLLALTAKQSEQASIRGEHTRLVAEVQSLMQTLAGFRKRQEEVWIQLKNRITLAFKAIGEAKAVLAREPDTLKRIESITAEVASLDTTLADADTIQGHVNELATIKKQWTDVTRPRYRNRLDALKAEIGELEASIKARTELLQSSDELARQMGELIVNRKTLSEQASRQYKLYEEVIPQEEKAKRGMESRNADRQEIIRSHQAEIAKLNTQKAGLIASIEANTAKFKNRLEEIDATAGILGRVPCQTYPGLPQQCELLAGANRAVAERDGVESQLSTLNAGTDPDSKLLHQIDATIANISQQIADTERSIERWEDEKPLWDSRRAEIGYDGEKHKAASDFVAKATQENLETRYASIPHTKTLLEAEQKKIVPLQTELIGLEAEYKSLYDAETERIRAKEAMIAGMKAKLEGVDLVEQYNRRELLTKEKTGLTVELEIVKKSLPEAEATHSEAIQILEKTQREDEAEIAQRGAVIAEKEAMRDKLAASLISDIDAQVEKMRQSVVTSEATLETVEGRLKALMVQNATTQAEVVRLRARAEQGVALRKENAGQMSTLELWRVLEQACYDEGIPQLELAASGPHISAIANDLLTGVMNTDYQIRFETLAEKKTGDGTKEVFDIIVNTDDGETDIRNLSGGERVWVDRGLFEAISIYLASTSTREVLANFADEADGALHSDRRKLYFAMLQEAHRVGRRHFTFVITHSQEILSQIAQQMRFHRAEQRIEMVF